MAITSTLVNVVQGAPSQANDVATTVAQATEDLVNAVVDAASKVGDTDSTTPDDTLLQTVVWIVDAAGAIAQDALNLTLSAAPTDTKAQRAAECARTWSIVAAIVAVIAIIVVEIVISVLTFGAASPLVLATIAGVAAVIAAIATVLQELPSLIQATVVASMSAIQSLSSAATPADQRERIRRDTADALRRAMTMIQTCAAQHLPAISVDLNRSLVAADQTSRALQKVLAFLRQRRASGRMAVVVTELGQLVQTHAALAARLRSTRPM